MLGDLVELKVAAGVSIGLDYTLSVVMLATSTNYLSMGTHVKVIIPWMIGTVVCNSPEIHPNLNFRLLHCCDDYLTCLEC